jgi:hypothetical protein
VSVAEQTLDRIVEALRRGSTRTLLQRRITFALDDIESLLLVGWSIAELAERLAKRGITQRNGQRLTRGHFGVLVARARAKARSARRGHTAERPPSAFRDARVPEATASPRSKHAGTSANLAKIAARDRARAHEADRRKHAERNIDAALGEMFGTNQSNSPPAKLSRASRSSALKRPLRRHSS